MKIHLTVLLIIFAQFGFAQSFNTYNFNTKYSDVLWDVIEYDSGYLLTGFSQDSSLTVAYNTHAEPVLLKLSKSGNPIDTLVTAGFGNTELNLLSIYNQGFFYTFGVTNPPNDSFELFVTKYDTSFNMIQRKYYPQLKGMHFGQLHKTKEMTDSSQYLIGYYYKNFDESFMLNYNFNTMEIDLYKELSFGGIMTDVLVDDTSYLCALGWYKSNPWASAVVRFDTALNTLSVDTLFVLGIAQNNILDAYYTLNHYKDSLYLCSGFANISPSPNVLYDYSSLVVQTYSPEFKPIDMKYWYYDSTVNLEPIYNNSFVVNNNGNYFIGATLNLDMFFPDQGLLVAKVDSNLNTIWQKHIACTTETIRLMNILPTDDGGVLLLYWEQASLAGAQLMNSKLMKIGPNGEVTSIIDLGIQTSKQAVTIYPNPATNIINIALKNQNQQISQLSIIDIQGRVVQQEMLNDKQTKIDVSLLPKGVYIIEGYTDRGERFGGKFVKE